MDEKMVKQSHKAIIVNRKMGSFTGVLDVISFDVSQVLLETDMGMLMIKGKDLHVNNLNLEKGEIEVEGLICTLDYSDVPKPKERAENLLGRLFR